MTTADDHGNTEVLVTKLVERHGLQREEILAKITPLESRPVTQQRAGRLDPPSSFSSGIRPQEASPRCAEYALERRSAGVLRGLVARADRPRPDLWGPVVPTPVFVLLLLIAVILIVLAFDWVSADVVGLRAMLTLVLTGLLTRTGVVDAIGRTVISCAWARR